VRPASDEARSKAHIPPDKVQHHERDSAHSIFQEIAFAYAILSDERRRKRYDATGNTSESLQIEDDDFNWSDFFKAQCADAVTVEKLNDFRVTYKYSEEERRDLLATYKSVNGDLDMIFTRVMLSSPLDDEDRFRDIINDAIAAGEVEAYKAFTHESEAKKKARHRRACGEGHEAEEYAKELGIWDDLFGNVKNKPKSNGKDDDTVLMDLIQKRKRGASSRFLDDLEAKYGGGQRKGKRQKFEEPPEELFEKNSRKMQKTAKGEAQLEDDEDEADLEADGPDSAGQEIKPAKSKGKGAKGVGRVNKRIAKYKVDVEDEDEAKGRLAKSKSIGANAVATKKQNCQDGSPQSASEVDDEIEDSAPVKSRSKGANGRAARSPRNAKRTSYVEAEGSESDFEEDEEQEFRPAKSKGKGSSTAKRGKERTMAVRKKR